jgi:hypothetical protein
MDCQVCGDKGLEFNIVLIFVQSNTIYFPGGNMFRLTNKSSSNYPVT